MFVKELEKPNYVNCDKHVIRGAKITSFVYFLWCFLYIQIFLRNYLYLFFPTISSPISVCSWVPVSGHEEPTSNVRILAWTAWNDQPRYTWLGCIAHSSVSTSALCVRPFFLFFFPFCRCYVQFKPLLARDAYSRVTSQNTAPRGPIKLRKNGQL